MRPTAFQPVGGTGADKRIAFQALYQDRGYLQAQVEDRIEVSHDPERAILIFTINAGSRASIRRVAVEGLRLVAASARYSVRSPECLLLFENHWHR